jgi:hypothetical protein
LQKKATSEQLNHFQATNLCICLCCSPRCAFYVINSNRRGSCGRLKAKQYGQIYEGFVVHERLRGIGNICHDQGIAQTHGPAYTSFQFRANFHQFFVSSALCCLNICPNFIIFERNATPFNFLEFLRQPNKDVAVAI